MSQHDSNTILTIAITSYNYSQYIGEAIDSVMKQTSPNWKLVICDNGSTDNTLEVIEPYLQDERVSLVVHSDNIGARKNIIYAMDVADTQYCSVLQADDFLEDTFVEAALYFFEHYPTSPFVIFNWHQFMDDSKTSVYHDRLPFQQDRAGPITIGPYLSICNFVPLHLAAFRTACIQQFSGNLLASPLKQVGEQFILKLLEDEYGHGCYSGTFGGQWRRHGDQITESQLENGVAILEEGVERHWYIDQAPNPSYTNVFMALATLIQRTSQISLLTSVNWLLHTEGQRYAENFGVPIEQERYRLLGTAFIVILKFSTFSSAMTFTDAEVEQTLQTLEHPVTRKGLEAFLLSMQALEGDAFINDDEIQQLCHRCFKSSSQLRDQKSVATEQRLNDDYQKWIAKQSWRESDVQCLAERMSYQWQTRPHFHFILWLGSNENEMNLLADTIDSLASQYYTGWQLTVISTHDMPDPVFADSPNLIWFQVAGSAKQHESINEAAFEIDADWVSLINPGVRYEPYTLASLVDYINIHPAWHLIYTDDDDIDTSAQRSSPRFKPEFNLDLIRSSNYIDDVWVKKTSLQIMGGVADLSGAQNYDIVLKTVDFFGEETIGHIDDVLVHQPKWSEREFDAVSGQLALEQHLHRNKCTAQVEPGLIDSTYRVVYQYDIEPTVSVVIAHKDHVDMLKRVVESLFSKTDYQNFSVIVVDNNSQDTELLDYYRELQDRYDQRFTLLHYDEEFNASAINNLAVEQASTDFVLLLNSGMEIVQAEWLSRMVSHMQRQDVGIVGAKLMAPNTALIQHAGVVLGVNQVAGHPFSGELTIGDPGYMGRAQLDQNYSAVTAACMLIDRSLYQAVGGMNAAELPLMFNDVDFCLRVQQKGFKVVWTPYALLVNHGDALMVQDAISLSEQAMLDYQTTMWRHWLPTLVNDPAYNKHLRLSTDFSLETEKMVRWDKRISNRIKVIGLVTRDEGHDQCLKSVLNLLDEKVLMQCEVSYGGLTHVDIARSGADVLFINDFSKKNLALLEQCKQANPALFIVGYVSQALYDFSGSETRAQFMRRLSSLLKDVDRIIVPNSALADIGRDLNKDVVIVAESIETEQWLKYSPRGQESSKPRVGWSGEYKQKYTFDIISPLIKHTSDQVNWVIVGWCPDELKPYVHEHYKRPKQSDFPLLMTSLNLDLALLPQDEHPMSDIASTMMFLHYAALGYPVLASATWSIKCEHLLITDNSLEAWHSAMKSALEQGERLAQQGQDLKHWLQTNAVLDHQLTEWAYGLSQDASIVERSIELARAGQA